MIPILSGIIVNHGHAVTHARAFVLSLAYVLGMAATYAAVGIAAGFSGTLLSNALQNAWVLSAFALIFVVLSLSMFGFYELQLPAALQSRLSDSANRQGGSLPAIAVMGALSALIVGPCVAAPLAGALLYIAQSKDAALGGAALFAMALGMGVPLLIVGVFSRSFLPKAGPWMEAVKKFFGVVMLATALWFVSPVIPVWTQMLGWAALLIVPAIFLRAIDPLPHHATNWHRLWKGIGVLMLLGGIAMLAGVLGGSRDPLQPLGFLKTASAQGGAVAAHGPKFERLLSVAELDEQLKTSKKPVMLDFYADWCVSCKEMEKFTFTDPKVAEAMSRFTLLQADVTANSDEDKALLKRFGLFGPPGIIFFDAAGREKQNLRVVGYMGAEQFLTILNSALR
jgi:thiol:disulfide interchange protein DsbD